MADIVTIAAYRSAQEPDRRARLDFTRRNAPAKLLMFTGVRHESLAENDSSNQRPDRSLAKDRG